MGAGANWTNKQIDILCEKWGTVSIPQIAEQLGRTTTAVKIKASRLHLGAALDNSRFVTLNVFLKAIGVTGGGYTLNLLKKAGLKIHMQKVEKCSFKMIDIDEFWKFVDKNRNMIDFSRFSAGTIGPEPEWVKFKREEDFKRKSIVQPHNTKWTDGEDKELIRLLREHKYTYPDIALRLHRSEGAIQRRVLDLGIKERPIKADNHTLWTEEQTSTLCDMIKKGSNYESISLIIGKSSKAIRGKVFATYLTENIDKARALICDGEWGDNRPSRVVSQRRLMSVDEKAEVSSLLSSLSGVLASRIRQHFEESDNWQRHLCRHWNSIKGCESNGTNCDSCSSFERIRAQHCARCGATFYERQENRMCLKCRKVKRKIGYKKYLRKQNKHSGSLFV